MPTTRNTRNNCRQCGKPIKSGRSDKKFCDSTCKDMFNNAMKGDERNDTGRINLILKKNRRVLADLFNPKKPDQSIVREVLIKNGFEFGFHTHVGITKHKSNEIVFCFDYGYREIEKGKYQLFHSFSKVQVKDGYELKINV